MKKKQYAALHEEPLKIFEIAEKKLEKAGIHTNVDTDKVRGLIREQDGKAAALHESVKEIDGRIDDIRQAQKIVAEIQARQDNRQEEKKAQVRREEER